MLISKRKYYRNFYIAMMVVSLLLFISGLIANNYLFHINVIGKICKYALIGEAVVIAMVIAVILLKYGGIKKYTAHKLNDLLKQSDKDRDIIEQQIIQCRKNIDLKTKKKARILDMYLDEKISEEEFISQRADIDKQIAAIQETLNELESLYGMEDVKQNSSKQICKLISEGKAEGFNKELFDLIVKQIVIGGKRSDGVDDPKSLHYELINYNLNTDMKKVVRKGILYYTMDIDMEKAMEEENGKKKEINDVYSFYSDHTCGDMRSLREDKCNARSLNLETQLFWRAKREQNFLILIDK